MAGSGTPRSELPAPGEQTARTRLQPGTAEDDQPTVQRTTAQVSAGLLMAAGTLVSRLLGFARAVMIAIVLGITTRQVEMFTIANTVPNSIYILLAGGALNTVFVPQIVRAIKHDEDHGEAYTNRILTATLMILAVISVVVTALAPALIWLYSDSAWHTAALAPQLDSMVMLAYLCLPQIFFYGAYTLVGQVLNARGLFGPMMWAPIINNVISVAVFALYLVVWGNGGDGTAAYSLGQELTLGIGSTLGIAAQAAILVPFMRRAGFRYRPRFDLRGTGLGHTFSLARWTLGFVLVTQVGVLVITRLASSASVTGEGAGWNAYNNAYLLWILPHSLITVSLVTAMLPTASALAADGNLVGVRDEATRTIRLALAAVLPVAAAFIALAGPLAGFVLGWGKGAGETGAVAWTLVAFAVGLVPFTVVYVCQRSYYAMEDTKTPFLQQCLVVAVNVLVAVALVVPFHEPDLIAPTLALAYSFAYVVGVVVAFRSLAVRLPGLSGRSVVGHGLRLLFAVAPAAVAAWAITWVIGQRIDGQAGRLLSLLLAAIVAVPAFWLMARLLKIDEVAEIAAPILRRLRLGRLVWTTPGGSIRSDDPDPGGAAGAGMAAGSPILGPEPPESVAPAEVTLHLDARGEPDAPDRSGNAQPTNQPADEPWDDTHTFDALADTEPGTSPAETTDPGRPTLPMLNSGRMLGQRYRLEEVMTQRRNIATWRAFDEVLSRSVVCHVLLPGDPRTERVMTAARKSAVATDSRFLRVLDAVQTVPPDESGAELAHPDEPGTGDPDIGSYVVCEYAPGQNLQTLLAHGPLTALEAAWVVREVADAMAGVHSAGLYHQRINPDTVIITPSGNIKIVGLLLEAALSTQPGTLDTTDPAELRRGHTPNQPDTDASDDVADLGRLLYACLIQRWPGGNQWGLLAAPTDGHSSWLSPHQVRAGVSPALDRICDQILLDRSRYEPIRTAHGVVNALTKVLGSADAAADLERRLRHPVPVIGQLPTCAGSPSTAFWAQQQAPASPPTPPTKVRSGPAGRIPHPAVAAAGATPSDRPPRRRWIGVLVLIVVLAMLVALGLAVASALRDRNGSQNPGTTPSSSPPASTAAPAEPVIRTIADVTDFDPAADGGNGEENPDEVPRAVDGNPETRWRTLSYRGNPELGGLKPGVGLVLDLGSAQDVSRVQLTLSGTNSAVEIRVPDDAAATSAPTGSADDWRVVATDDDADGSATLDLSEPVTTRFVLVYFTSLPAEDGDYRGGIYEVEVLG